MCTLCDSTNINTIIEFAPGCLWHVSGDGYNDGSDSYLQFRDTQVHCLLKLCIPPSNGMVRWWLFPEFGAELALGNSTPTIILNNIIIDLKYDGRLTTGLIWLRIRTSVLLLWRWQWTTESHKMQSFS